MNRAKALALLGLTGKPSEDEIKKAYRKMSMKYHPDRVDEKDKDTATEKFKEMKEAYEFLEKKEEDPITVNSDFWANYNKQMNDFEQEINRARWQHEQMKQARHYQVTIKISLKEAFTGVTKKVDLTKVAGFIETVDIGAGMKPGMKLKTVAGKNAGVDYTIDLVLDIDVEDASVVWATEPWLYGGAKEGSGNITQTMYVDWFTIMTGGFKSVFTIDGSTGTVRIPSGFEAGKMLKIKGKGYWTDAKQSNRGDLLLRVMPTIPKLDDLTPEQIQTFINHTKYKMEEHESKAD